MEITNVDSFSSKHARLCLISYSNLLGNDSLWTDQLHIEGTIQSAVQARREKCRKEMMNWVSILCTYIGKVEEKEKSFLEKLEAVEEENRLLRNEIERISMETNSPFRKCNQDELQMLCVSLTRDIENKTRECERAHKNLDCILEKMDRLGEVREGIVKEKKYLHETKSLRTSDGISKTIIRECSQILERVENILSEMEDACRNGLNFLSSLSPKSSQKRTRKSTDPFHGIKLVKDSASKMLNLKHEVQRLEDENEDIQCDLDKTMDDLFRFAERNSYLESKNKQIQTELFRMEGQKMQMIDELERLYRLHIPSTLEAKPPFAVATPVQSTTPTSDHRAWAVDVTQSPVQRSNSTPKTKYPINSWTKAFEKLSIQEIQKILEVFELDCHKTMFFNERVDGAKLINMEKEAFEKVGVNIAHQRLFKKIVKSFNEGGGVPLHMVQSDM